MPTFYKAPEANFWSTTLNGDISDSVDTITLTSVANLQAPGCIVVDREDGSGTATPGSREVITFTGISGSDLTGCTRGAMNSVARAHTDGALVEAVMGVDYWNDLRNAVAVALTTDGTGLAISGTASIAAISADSFKTQTIAGTSTASINTLTTGTLTSGALHGTTAAFASNASVAGIWGYNIGMTSVASISHVAYNASKPYLKVDTDGATVTFNMNESNVHSVVLGGNRTLAVSNVGVGQSFIVRLVQDATGSRTVTWFSTIKWADGTAPTLTTTANKTDVFGFLCTSANNYDGYIVGQNL